MNYSAGAGTEARGYNSLNQLVSIERGDTISMHYLYAAGKDNGQITEATDEVNGESILYSYDSLKRLNSAAASAVPLIPNHSFEQAPPTYWTGATPSTVQVSDVSPHSGTYSAHFLTAGSTLTQGFSSCVAGTTYTITGYHKEDASMVGSVTISAGSQNKSQTVQNASAWTQFSFTFTPTSCSGAYIEVEQPAPQTASGTVWFDDLSVTAGGSNLLTDPGFEQSLINPGSIPRVPGPPTSISTMARSRCT